MLSTQTVTTITRFITVLQKLVLIFSLKWSVMAEVKHLVQFTLLTIKRKLSTVVMHNAQQNFK